MKDTTLFGRKYVDFYVPPTFYVKRPNTSTTAKQRLCWRFIADENPPADFGAVILYLF